jgi:hypothetical protein
MQFVLCILLFDFVISVMYLYDVLVNCPVYAWPCAWLSACVIVLLLGSTRFYGSVFPIYFSVIRSGTCRVRHVPNRINSFPNLSISRRHVPDQISSFPNLSISRKFVFVFVSDLSEFDFIFVFKCESENNFGVTPTEFDRFQPYS